MGYKSGKMPHADSSYFEAGLSKAEVYSQVLQQAQALIEGRRSWVSNLANVSSLLWHAYASLPAPSNAVNWAGFYVRKDKSPSSADATAHDAKSILLLGPFQGKPACQLIPFGRGVCGTAAANQETVIVPDVLQWPGHIACDAESRSEIVVPIVVDGETVAIIDIDCTQPSAFDEVDRKGLEDLAALLKDGCDW